jgi:hypothetical protein
VEASILSRTDIRAREPEIGRLRLAPGSHSSPRDGVCVVELASLLAGERFSDRPDCVCRVIAGYLRSLNDRVSHSDRQRPLPYAQRAVGSRGGRTLTHARRDLCLVWAGARPGAGPIRRLFGRLAMRARVWVVVGARQAFRLDDGAGEYAARVVFARHGTKAAFNLLDRLFEVGSEPAPLADPVRRAAQARVAAAIRELAGDAPAAQREHRGQGGDHNGHPDYLGRGHARNGHEEDVEDDRAEHGDPERETEPVDDPHVLASVP